MKKIIIVLIVVALGGLGFYFVRSWQLHKLDRNPNFASGNGRVEATEINIAAKLAGKVEQVLVDEGDRISAGQVLVQMQTNVLEAQREQAKAKREQAITAEASANAKIQVQEAMLESMNAGLLRAQAAANNAENNYKRYKELVEQDATSKQHFENAETAWLTQKAELLSAQAAIKEAEANVNAAKADAAGAKANILAAEADIASIQADIDDSTLKSPLEGRVQYRVAEPGEVLAAGGRALNMVDLTDVYMTFFLPEEIAGKVKIGSEVRLVIDAFPDYAIPAKISYVACVAQFTPKTVETKVERQKLMFRVKAHIDPERLKKYIDMVKTGLPGVAWVRLNDEAEWPVELQTRMEKGIEQ